MSPLIRVYQHKYAETLSCSECCFLHAGHDVPSSLLTSHQPVLPDHKTTTSTTSNCSAANLGLPQPQTLPTVGSSLSVGTKHRQRAVVIRLGSVSSLANLVTVRRVAATREKKTPLVIITSRSFSKQHVKQSRVPTLHVCPGSVQLNVWKLFWQWWSLFQKKK